jgi:hypothetical protein
MSPVAGIPPSFFPTMAHPAKPKEQDSPPGSPYGETKGYGI